MTQTTSPYDTGEIELGGATRDLSAHAPGALIKTSTFRRPDSDQTGELRISGVAAFPTGAELAVAARPAFEGPQQPVPIPVPPKPSVDLAAAQPLFPLERVITADEIPGYVGRHRDPLDRHANYDGSLGGLRSVLASAWARVRGAM